MKMIIGDYMCREYFEIKLWYCVCED